jgi:hypothetical protein
MITGISALGQGDSARRPGGHIPLGLWHLEGGAIGGALVAFAFWILLSPVRTLLPAAAVGWTVVLVAAFSIAMELGLVRAAGLDQGQVPPEWTTRFGRQKAYLLYGVSLGSGVTTHVEFAATYTVFIAGALLLDLPAMLAVGVTFGVARTWLVGPVGASPRAKARFVAWQSRGSHRFTLVSVAVSASLSVLAVIGA